MSTEFLQSCVKLNKVLAWMTFHCGNYVFFSLFQISNKHISYLHPTVLAAKSCGSIKDTHKEKERSNKTPSLIKSRNMGIWVAGTST